MRGGLAALLVAVVFLTGCASPADRGSVGDRTAAAPAPSGPPCMPPASSTAGAPSGSATGPSLNLTLPCFTGGQPVRLSKLGTPAVINLWASWCGPCRTELPELQRFADRAAGRVQVVGVITSDPNRGGAQSLIDDLKLRFPMLYDGQAKLQAQIGPPVAMPTTLLVDAGGRVAYRHSARPLDEAALADLVRQHLGVAV
ncbi:TlpA family protein disulfide reductase [Planosporangium flavigriseum]|uniref:TlpA family protein disulfide reductase n=1 Tax=Planosporangium flavigriseum TaxID=373681 RepID=UPI00143AF93C|nr:TlpA disulfide reductase family protein [Planosporangium flavigriseum]NJC63761.1 TlpA family protein disulfide reductase [Planosporangium flavigriseum]